MPTLDISPALRTESDAYLALERIRWCDGIADCPHCETSDAELIGGGFRTRTGKVSPRRIWQCSNPDCYGQFSVLTGSVLHGSKLSLRSVLTQLVAPSHMRAVMRTHGVAWRSAKRIMDVAESIRADGLVRVRRTNFTAFGQNRWVPGAGRVVYLDAPRGGRTNAHDFISTDGEWSDPTFDAVLEALHNDEIETRVRTYKWNLDNRQARHHAPDTTDATRVAAFSTSVGQGMASRHRGRVAQQALMSGKRIARKSKVSR